jgi:CBS domain-containing protein
MQVREIMTSFAGFVGPECPLRDVADTMRKTGLDCLAVVERDHTVGMITEHDMTCRALAVSDDPGAVAARQIMSDQPCSCFADDEIDAAWRKMEALHVRRLVVVNHEEYPVGVVRRGDFVRGDAPLPVQAFVEAYLDFHR